jgi:hypothetical protein
MVTKRFAKYREAKLGVNLRIVKVLPHLECHLEFPVELNGDQMVTRKILTTEFRVRIRKRVEV